jgi:hypothetical protein
MPWSKSDLPDAVKNEKWSAHQTDVFIHAANAALKEYGDDGKAIAVGINAANSLDNSMPETIALTKRIPFIEAGVCNYSDLGIGNVLIRKETIDQMCNSFKGKPVVIEHNFNIKTDNVHGYVNNIFYNSTDGQHYADFLVHTKEGKEASNKLGFGSCSYKPILSGKGGSWHGVEYTNEVIGGEFTHLALTGKPRYENAKIFNNSKESKKMFEVDEKSIVGKVTQNITEFFNTRFPQKTEAKDDHIVFVNGKEITILELKNEAAKKYEDSPEDKKKDAEGQKKLDEEAAAKKAKDAEKPKEKEMDNSFKELPNSISDLLKMTSKESVDIENKDFFGELSNARQNFQQPKPPEKEWLSSAERYELAKKMGI